MKILSAQKRDIPSVLDINRSVNVMGISSEAKGFLIYRYDEATLLPMVEKGQVLVAELSDEAVDPEVVGYLVYQHWAEPKMEETRNQMRTVVGPSIDLFALERLVWISQLGVAFSAGRIGVGSALYRALFEKFPGHSFAATVAEIPHNNEASAALHRKLGFLRIGLFETDDFHGVKNYRSGVYCRK